MNYSSCEKYYSDKYDAEKSDTLCLTWRNCFISIGYL